MVEPPRERLASRRAFAGRIVKVDVETIRAPDGSTLELEIIRHAGASAVVALTGQDRSDPGVLLLQQYRYAASGMLWEIPAGVLEPGETPVECARRELMEEAGARAEAFEHLTTIYTTPGFTDEQIHLFLATQVTVGEPRPAPDEFIEVREVRLSRALDMIRNREMQDAKSIVAILYAARYRFDR
jgi:ADP-ribose pyrophosphatase